MSAPPGWHLQPDGRERYWDGQQWTTEFRDPVPSDPTAPPALPDDTGSSTWSAGDPTQALGVDRTQSMPSVDPAASAGPAAQPPAAGGVPVPPAPSWAQGPGATAPVPPQQAPAQAPYQAPGAPVGYPGAYPGGPAQPGGPGQPWQQPPARTGMSSGAKGCLIAAVIGVVVLIGIAVAAVFFVSAATKKASDSFSSLASNFPSVPTDIGGDPIDLQVGDGFELRRASVADGWTIDTSGAIGAEVKGMRATFTDSTSLPVVFQMDVQGDTGTSSTTCTATPADGETTVDVVCLPLVGFTGEPGDVTVTPSF